MVGGQKVYVLDTNVFVEAARRYYAFDIVPGFWQMLIDQARIGNIISIDRVKSEIDRGDDDDDLKTWANSNFYPWFVSTDEDVVNDAYRRIMEQANRQKQFTPYAKAEFSSADNADAWLVAYALSKNYLVVTHEQYAQDIKREIKIPNVCKEFGVEWLDIYQMLRALHVRLC